MSEGDHVARSDEAEPPYNNGQHNAEHDTPGPDIKVTTPGGSEAPASDPGFDSGRLKPPACENGGDLSEAGPPAGEDHGPGQSGTRGGGVPGPGILKTSYSSSHLQDDQVGVVSPRRASAMHQSLAHNFKRVSISAAAGLSGHDDVSDKTALLRHLPPAAGSGRRSTVRQSTSYGAVYPPIYQKLSLLHRLSFADIVERITLTWQNIDVYAPVVSGGGKVKRGLSASTTEVVDLQKKHILKDVSGVVEPGTLLAVMGASGSGKTTLLNVLTYRNRGNLTVTGDVRVNGGIIGRGMSSMSAYIQQEDIFIGTLTVREHLWFQAQLKMDREIPKDMREERVADVMKEMSLNKCADVMIGIPGKIKGISGGEKKRLAFASEVLTNPPLLFLDEPTSGLDSYMAQNILKTLKMMAAKGRSIMCTIHQPSSEVFELFDRLLLMAEGRIAYLGPAKEACGFFGSCGFVLPQNYNPADFLVRTLAIEPGREEQCRDKIKLICDNYMTSPQGEYVQKIIGESNFHEDGAMYEEESFSNIDPCVINNLREPSIFRVRLFQITVLAFIFGLVYWQQKIDQISINNINGCLFLMQTQMTFGFIFNVVMTFPPEYPIFLREHLDGMYRVDVYYLCKTMAEVPQFVLLPLVFTIIMYWCVGLYASADAFFICFAANLLVCNVSVSFGYLLSCCTSNIGLALAIAPLFVVPCSMIGGFFVNPETIPIYFVWLKFVSWFTYANEIMVVNQWSRIDSIACPLLPGPADGSVTSTISSDVTQMLSTIAGMPSSNVDRCLTSGQEVIDMFGYKESNMAFDFAMLVVLLLAFRIIAFIMLYFRSRQSYKIGSKKPAAGPLPA